jgi:hypothetical protein
MNRITHIIRSFFFLASLAISLSACTPEYGVDFATATEELEGMEIENSSIVLEVGQVIGVRPTATKNGERKEDWDVELESVENPIFSALPTYASSAEDKVYAVIAHQEGAGSFTMITKDKHEVTVVVNIVPRTTDEVAE